MRTANEQSSLSLCHWWSLLAPTITLTGFIFDFPAAGAVVILLIFPLLDLALGRSNSEATALRPFRPRLLLYLHVLVHTAVVISLMAYAMSQGLTLSTWIASLSAGICSGISGIIVAHELGHSRAHWIDPWLARWNLTLVLYSHFTLEHNRHHHPTVATEDDPASAPRERNFWQQLVFTIPRQFASAWRIAEQRKNNMRFNAVLLGLITQAILLVAVASLFSVAAMLALVLQAFVSIFLLEYVNYIRHYGLRRKRGEPLSAEHAWQTEARWSRWTLLELTRHPAHHLHAGLPFWELRPYPNAPSLPGGYYAMFWPALLPAWWQHLMRPLLEKFQPSASAQ